MPYKYDSPNHAKTVVSDHTSTILVKINHISILQILYNEQDKKGNIFPSSTKNGYSIDKTKLFNFTSTFSSEIATLLALSTSCNAIKVKVVQNRIIYHVQEDDVNQNGSTENMKVLTFLNCDGIVRRKVERLYIDNTCMEENGGSTGGIEESFAVFNNVNNVYEEMSIRRSKRAIFQPEFFTSYTSFNFGRSSYRKSANVPSSSKSQPKKEHENKEATLQNKHAETAAKCKQKQDAVQKEKESRHYQLYKKHGVKRKNYFSTKECEEFVEELMKDPEMQNETPFGQVHEKHGAKGNYLSNGHGDLIDQLMKDQGMRKKKRRPYSLDEKHGAKRKYFSTKECDDLIEELIADCKCYKKAEPDFQHEEEVCASAQGCYPIDEVFTWPPIDDDVKIKEEKDEYKDLWEEMDNCLNMCALEEEKKVL